MTLGPFYTTRGAEIFLDIAPYTIRRIAEKHPLPKAAIIVDDRPAWTQGQILEWYEARPKHGGARKSKKFKESQVD